MASELSEEEREYLIAMRRYLIADIRAKGNYVRAIEKRLGLQPVSVKGDNKRAGT